MLLNLDTVISTNNYAMQLIDADKAQHGMSILAAAQTGGKGQRGRSWVDEKGKSLLMSTILQPGFPLNQQFLFSASVALAVAETLLFWHPGLNIQIKWPNDIIINDRKAGGILIENVLRGPAWVYAVVGLGLNVLQDGFPATLPWATSLYLETGQQFSIQKMAEAIRESLLPASTRHEGIMDAYNLRLYERHKMRQFSDSSGRWMARIEEVLPDGQILLMHGDGISRKYRHGSVEWIW